MVLYMVILISILTALLSIAVTGFIFYKIAQAYFDNQQKAQMLQMKIDEHKDLSCAPSVLVWTSRRCKWL